MAVVRAPAIEAVAEACAVEAECEAVAEVVVEEDADRTQFNFS